ncbi:MAG: hypothetical protein BAJALOKI1v1_2340003 [Promethearchaeota archaeon]|nr:MAG: hypothetical protein BAJALOKI1v1_2340003 [Candidatus Lokiarchaeota archaeon]
MNVCGKAQIVKNAGADESLQFQTYLDYKAASTGHLVEYESPRDTSHTCLKCGKKRPARRTSLHVHIAGTQLTAKYELR